MVNLGLLKNLKQKGAMFIEYALVLAFVVVVGVLFISDGGIKNSIAGIFGKAGDTLEVAVNGGEKVSFSKVYSLLNDMKYKINDIEKSGEDKKIFSKLESGQQFEINDELEGILIRDRLINAGIEVPKNLDNFYVFKQNDGKYGLAWTEDNIGSIKDGYAKTIIYSYSAGSDKGAYYIANTSVTNGKLNIDKSPYGQYTTMGYNWVGNTGLVSDADLKKAYDEYPRIK